LRDEITWEVITSCIIMHNMVVQEERDDNIYNANWEFQCELVEPHVGAASWEILLAYA
jgi:hypothetical protein